MNKDLTAGEPRKVLWSFCLPLFGSVVFQQLYNLADSFVAGKYIGEQALASVGNSYEITLIFLAFAFGCNIACSVVTSRLFGSRDHTAMKSGISTAMISTAIVCFILMLIGIAGGPTLLRMINTPDQLFNDSHLYLKIYTFGLPFVFFYNVSTGIFSALGDSRTPFIFLAFSSLSNIAADILFVKEFKMGVSGVAWATFMCQGISCLLALIFVLRRIRSIESERKYPLFSVPLFKQLIVIAIPSILQQSFISVGNIIIQGLINNFGSGVIAGYSAGVKLNNLVITSFTTIGNGISNYTAQNIGGGRTDRLRPGFRAGLQMIWCLSIPLALLYFLFPGTLLSIFMDEPSADALHAGTMFLRILSPFYIIISAKLVADGILRGASEMRNFTISTLLDLILRVVLAAVLCTTSLRSTGIWCAWPIGWCSATALSVYFCLGTIRRSITNKT